MTRQLNIETLYSQYEGLIIGAATERRFISAIGSKEDAIQEAGLAFMETVRNYKGAETDFPKFLKASIYNHLCNIAKREIRYKKHTNVVFDEAYTTPDLSIEEILENNEKLLREDLFLTILHQLLIHPQLMIDKAHLSVYESVVIGKLFYDKMTEIQIVRQMKLSQSYISLLKKQGLKKLKDYLLNL